MDRKPTYEELEQRVKELTQAESERKQVEFKLKDSEKRSHAWLEYSPICTKIVDLDFNLQYMSAAGIKGLGIDDITQIYGKPYPFDFYPESFRNLMTKNLEKVKETGEIITQEGCMIDIEENELWFHSTLVPVNDDEGRIDYIIVVSIDITERKQMEEILHKEMELNQAVLNNIEDGIVACNAEGILTLFNRATREFHGIPEKHLPANEWAQYYDLFLPDGKTPMKTEDVPLFKALKGRYIRDVEMVIAPKDGKKRVLLASGQPLFVVGGKKLGAVVSMHDITERKRAEAELQKAYDGLEQKVQSRTAKLEKANEQLKQEIKERKQTELELYKTRAIFQTAMDQSQAGIAIADAPNGNLRYVNDAGLGIREKSKEEIVDGIGIAQYVTSWQILHLDGTPYKDDEVPLARAVLYGETNSQEFIIRRPDNEDRFVLANAAPVLNDKGEVTAGVVVFLDITERKFAEKEKEELEVQLRQTHKMEAIGTLAGGIAHDFNNILGIIVGNTELSLGDVPEWNPARQYLKEVQKACLRARDVVRQLLSFSRKSDQQKTPTKISPIIKETSKLLRASIPSNVDIQYHIPDELGTIMADPTQIHQVLLNLCTNAADAMAGLDGVLSITQDSLVLDEGTAESHKDLDPGPYVRLQVSDTGQGIGPEDISRIFDPYFTTKEVGKGTGLGLSVVHGIVKSHGGSITVHSEIGKGTTFEVFFPMIEEEAEKPPVITAAIPTGDERILFVDDEEAMVELGKKGLERLGYRVEATTSAQKALELFRSKPDGFDLVITDMTMPEMTGDKLAEEIMKTRPNMPVILCTGYSEQISEEKAKDIGICAFVMKPYLASEIATAIRQVLDQGKEERIHEKIKVLVVDDEEQMRSIIRQMLESAGYDVMEAPDGKVALWLFKEKPADLIITDLLMPEKEGLETIMELKRDFPNVKIIAISGGGQGDKGQYIDMAKKMGANSTLAKPFEKEELLKEVRDLLR